MKTILLSLAIAASAYGQTIVNPSFEDITGLTSVVGTNLFAGTPTGWTSSNGNFSVWKGGYTQSVILPGKSYANTFTAPSNTHGSYFLQQTAANAKTPQVLSQMISGFTVGKQYKLTFDAGIVNWDYFLDQYWDLNVTMSNGATILGQIGEGGGVGDSSAGSPFTSKEMIFTANATSQLLSIKYAGSPDLPFYSMAVDNFKIAAVVPEASITFLSSIGLLGMAFRRRRA